MSKIFRFAILSLTLVSVVLVIPATNAGPDGRKPDVGRLSLVYNVNNGGYVDVCGCKRKKVRNGSLTRRSSFLGQLRSTGRHLLLLDGGSTLFSVNDEVQSGQRVEAIRKARLIVESYNRMGYRAMALGVSDIAMGLDTLQELVKKARFDVLSANFLDRKTGKPIFKPHAVYTVNGVRVGVIGLTLETMGSAYVAGAAPGATIDDPLTAAKRAVAELEGKTDIIIALSHIKQESNYELCRQLREIAIVLDPFIVHQGHRTWIKEEEWLGVLDETLFVRTDGQGARLGILDITVDNPGAKLGHRHLMEELEEALRAGTATDDQKATLATYRERNLYTFERVAIGPHHHEDPDIDKLIEEWKKGIDPSKVARLQKDLPMRDQYLGFSKCGSCHEAQFKFWSGTSHATALESLEETGDEHRYDCIGCHSLGYGTAFVDTSKVGPWANVQCESCHGASPKHADDPARHPFGKLQEKTCLRCHNKEHTLKDFHFFGMRKKMACPAG